MAKVTAGEMDKIIMLIPRLTLRQLDRMHALIHAEEKRKLDGKPEPKEATP